MFSQNLPSINYFHKTLFVGLLESASLRVEIPVEVRLPTTESPQTPRKRDPHWELLLLLLLLLLYVVDTTPNITKDNALYDNKIDIQLLCIFQFQFLSKIWQPTLNVIKAHSHIRIFYGSIW